MTDNFLIIRVLLAIIIIILFICFLAYRKYRKYSIPIWGMIPIVNSIYFKNKAKKETKLAEDGTKYLLPGEDDKDGKKFQAFLRDLPKYCIEDNFVSSNIRSMMKMAGAEYKQVVLINKADITDKKLWIRKQGQHFIHEKGTYFNPWECVKDVFYWDIVDSRPLIDMTKDMNWTNPEMCAEVVTAVTNTNAMRNLSDDAINQLVKSIHLLLIITAIAAGVAILGIYLNYKNTELITGMIDVLTKKLSQ